MYCSRNVMKQITLKTYSKMRHKMYRLMPKCVQQIGCMKALGSIKEGLGMIPVLVALR